MNLTNVLLFALPTALVILKIAVISVGVVWSVRGAVESRTSFLTTGVRPLPAPLHPRNPQD